MDLGSVSTYPMCLNNTSTGGNILSVNWPEEIEQVSSVYLANSDRKSLINLNHWCRSLPTSRAVVPPWLTPRHPHPPASGCSCREEEIQFTAVDSTAVEEHHTYSDGLPLGLPQDTFQDESPPWWGSRRQGDERHCCRCFICCCSYLEFGSKWVLGSGERPVSAARQPLQPLNHNAGWQEAKGSSEASCTGSYFPGASQANQPGSP